MNYLRAFILIVGFTLAVPGFDCLAQTTDCLTNAKGKILRWNSRWGEPLVDNNTFYIVEKVEHPKTGAKHNATIRLVAKDSAEKLRRSLTVKEKDQVKNVCARMRPYQSSSEKKEENPILDRQSLPFIRHTEHGWVLAKREVDVSETAICQVFERTFACLPEEKEQFGATLRDIETKARFSGI